MKSTVLKKAAIITVILVITAASVFAYGGHHGNHGSNHNSDNHNGSGHNSGCYTDGNLNHDGTQHHSGNYSYSQPSGTVQPTDMTENKTDSTATL